ncbi:MAG TPA: hypothetical protein VJ858_02415 [Acidimicrobiia bacterium]|nr:hypothetical protein [Acidimicrobiia bacterium]
MKRLSPLLLAIVAAAAVIAFRKGGDRPLPEPAEEWKPVDPS